MGACFIVERARLLSDSSPNVPVGWVSKLQDQWQ